MLRVGLCTVYVAAPQVAGAECDLVLSPTQARNLALSMAPRTSTAVYFQVPFLELRFLEVEPCPSPWEATLDAMLHLLVMVDNATHGRPISTADPASLPRMRTRLRERLCVRSSSSTLTATLGSLCGQPDQTVRMALLPLAAFDRDVAVAGVALMRHSMPANIPFPAAGTTLLQGGFGTNAQTPLDIRFYTASLQARLREVAKATMPMTAPTSARGDIRDAIARMAEPLMARAFLNSAAPHGPPMPPKATRGRPPGALSHDRTADGPLHVDEHDDVVMEEAADEEVTMNAAEGEAVIHRSKTSRSFATPNLSSSVAGGYRTPGPATVSRRWPARSGTGSSRGLGRPKRKGTTKRKGGSQGRRQPTLATDVLRAAPTPAIGPSAAKAHLVPPPTMVLRRSSRLLRKQAPAATVTSNTPSDERAGPHGVPQASTSMIRTRRTAAPEAVPDAPSGLASTRVSSVKRRGRNTPATHDGDGVGASPVVTGPAEPLAAPELPLTMDDENEVCRLAAESDQPTELVREAFIVYRRHSIQRLLRMAAGNDEPAQRCLVVLARCHVPAALTATLKRRKAHSWLATAVHQLNQRLDHSRRLAQRSHSPPSPSSSSASSIGSSVGGRFTSLPRHPQTRLE